MILDYAENIFQLLANVTALLLSLFQYISTQKKGWIYATSFFLAGLMSSYYWTAYLIVMGDTPNVSSLISDTGWNIAFFILLLLVLYMREEGAKQYFHPLMLLTEYAKNAEEKARELKEYFDEQDWHLYAVSVHALKSTSKMIGAAGLSEMAARMEAAADAGRADTDRNIHDDMLSRYTELVEAIVRTLESGKNQTKDEGSIEFQPEESEEIVEFQPEEGEEIVEFQPEEGEELIEFQPEEDEEIIEFQPEED